MNIAKKELKYKAICEKIVKCLNYLYPKYKFEIEETHYDAKLSNLSICYYETSNNRINLFHGLNFQLYKASSYHILFNNIMRQFNIIVCRYSTNYSRCLMHDNIMLRKLFGNSFEEANVKCDLILCINAS